jgi:hypothetical protein
MLSSENTVSMMSKATIFGRLAIAHPFQPSGCAIALDRLVGEPL